MFIVSPFLEQLNFVRQASSSEVLPRPSPSGDIIGRSLVERRRDPSKNNVMISFNAVQISWMDIILPHSSSMIIFPWLFYVII